MKLILYGHRKLDGDSVLLSRLREIFVNYEKEKSEGYRIRSRIPHFEIEESKINYYSKMEKN